MSVGDLGLGKLDISRLDLAVCRPFFSRREYQWLTIKNRPITILAKDDVLREGDIAQRDPGIAHSAYSFRNLVIDSSIILKAAFRSQPLHIPNAVSCWMMKYGSYTTHRLSPLRSRSPNGDGYSRGDNRSGWERISDTREHSGRATGATGACQPETARRLFGSLSLA